MNSIDFTYKLMAAVAAFGLVLTSPVLAEEDVAALRARREALLKEARELETQIEALDKRLPPTIKVADKQRWLASGKVEDCEKPPEEGSIKTTERGLLPPAIFKLMEEERFAVRQSVYDVEQMGLPALFEYSLPGVGDDSWIADVGASFRLWNFGEGHELQLRGEYHYNVEAAVDTTLSGLAYAWHFAENCFGECHLIKASVDFRQDGVLGAEGWVANIIYNPCMNLTKGPLSFGNWFDLTFKPYIGAEVESLSGEGPNADAGRVSLKAGANLVAQIMPKYFGNRFELCGRALYWNHLDRQDAYSGYDQNQLWLICELDYWLNADRDGDGWLTDQEKVFGVTVRYSNGDNPVEGKQNIDLLTVGLAVKF
jgi:hypothetical protein